MTNKEAEPFIQLDLDSLQYFWLPNGAPCFVADREDICDQVEGLGFQIYYLIANEEIVTTNNSSGKNNNATKSAVYSYQQTKYHGKLLKVVKNIVGRAVAASQEDFGKTLLSFKEEAEYHLPPIPRAMVQKLDEFFRLVHAQHGTESIVILTFDSTKEGSDGWGILVPEQTNTAAHCKYDPDSVAYLKDDHVLIVGSVHSHPEMSAYASGTDHEDQADFDGLHITFGWQKSVGNGATQYHAELQMGGTNYIMSIDDIFEDFNLQKDPDPEVVEWTEKVKKTQAPALGAYNPSTHHKSTQNYYNSGTTSTGSLGITNSYYSGYDSSRFVQKRQQYIPEDILRSIPYNAVIAAEIDTSEMGRMLCPSCGLSLFKNEIYLGSSCPSCDLPIVSMNTQIDTIVKSINGYQNKRARSIESPYYLWARNTGGSKNHTIFLIKPAHSVGSSIKGDDNLKEDTSNSINKSAQNESDADLQMDLREEYEKKYFSDYDNGIISIEDYSDLSFELEYWATRTWCCERDVSTGDLSVCNCAVTVTEDDIIEYDAFCNTNSLNVYAPTGDCQICAFYYTGSCPSYREGVVTYRRFSTNPTDLIIDRIQQNLNVTGCHKWQRYSNIESQIEKDMEERSYDNTY